MQVTFFFKVYFYFDIVRVAKREKKKSKLEESTHYILWSLSKTQLATIKR